MITSKPLKATCVDRARHRAHGDACLARERSGRALCVLCADAKFKDDATTTERLALCEALADVAGDASAHDDVTLREATLELIGRACGRQATTDVCVEALLEAAKQLDGLDAARGAEALASDGAAWRRARGRRLVAALCCTARRGAFWNGPGALRALNAAVVEDDARTARECCAALDAVTRDDPGAAHVLLVLWAPRGAAWARAAERARDDDREAGRRGLERRGHGASERSSPRDSPLRTTNRARRRGASPRVFQQGETSAVRTSSRSPSLSSLLARPWWPQRCRARA